jgi:hypothetical protein
MFFDASTTKECSSLLSISNGVGEFGANVFRKVEKHHSVVGIS